MPPRPPTRRGSQNDDDVFENEDPSIDDEIRRSTAAAQLMALSASDNASPLPPDNTSSNYASSSRMAANIGPMGALRRVISGLERPASSEASSASMPMTPMDTDHRVYDEINATSSHSTGASQSDATTVSAV